MFWVVLVLQRKQVVINKYQRVGLHLQFLQCGIGYKMACLLCTHDAIHNIWNSCCSVIKHVPPMYKLRREVIWKPRSAHNCSKMFALHLQIKQIFLSCCKWVSNICRNKMNNIFVILHFYWQTTTANMYYYPVGDHTHSYSGKAIWQQH